ncbi:unnamed protein product [Lymnaea stagnalis]|uniref:Cilia- and flagella-associated protein 77 n=1 Tax=Lymnaea stagnalis TaxID=6523 RepID=A0AAV2IKS1_LYMST
MPHPWQTDCDPFNLTSTGYLGRKRDEMLVNEILLNKDKIGKARLRGRSIPRNLCFGDTLHDPWTAAHAITGWSGHLPTKKEMTGQAEVFQNDYLQLNRAAITSGIVTPQESRVFRKTHFRKYAPAAVDGKLRSKKIERPPPRRLDPNTVYGKVEAPDPPLNDVLRHKFQDDWILNKKEQTKISLSTKSFETKKSRWAQTRASLLRTVMVPVDCPSQPWRLEKFVSKAKPHLSTFRSEKELAAAWNANTFEKTGRLGETGQGITTRGHGHMALPPIDPKECVVYKVQ